MTLLKLASHLKGKYENYDYNGSEIAGFLMGLRYCKKINDSHIYLVLQYVKPEHYFRNYTEIDEMIPKIKKKLERVILNENNQ
jgi:hypothetical protein